MGDKNKEVGCKAGDNVTHEIPKALYNCLVVLGIVVLIFLMLSPIITGAIAIRSRATDKHIEETSASCETIDNCIK